MFVLRYFQAVVAQAAAAWIKAMLLVLGLGPVLVALVYRAVPGFPRNLDDPLLAASIVWFLVLVLVMIPARLWSEQRRQIAELQSRADAEAAPFEFLRGAQITHSTFNYFLTDEQGRRFSNGSNTLIRTPQYDAVLYPGGTVTADAGVARGLATAYDATVVAWEPDRAEPQSPQPSRHDP